MNMAKFLYSNAHRKVKAVAVISTVCFAWKWLKIAYSTETIVLYMVTKRKLEKGTDNWTDQKVLQSLVMQRLNQHQYLTDILIRLLMELKNP